MPLKMLLLLVPVVLLDVELQKPLLPPLPGSLVALKLRLKERERVSVDRAVATAITIKATSSMIDLSMEILVKM
jgi:hypothetical protein